MDLIANLFNPDPLILQTAAFAIYTIDKKVYQEHSRRLKPMTKKELDKAILPPVFKNDEEVYHQKMLLIERVFLLKKMEVFYGVPGVQIAHLAEAMDEIMISAGTTLVAEGDSGNTPLYVIIEGDLDIMAGEEVIGSLKEGDIVGEKKMLESEKFDFSVVSKSNCKLLVLTKEELFDLMSLHLEIVEAVLGILKEKNETIEEANTMELFV
jgi:hypothetical protein